MGGGGEAIPQYGVVAGPPDRRLGRLAYVEGGAVIVGDALLLLVQRCVDAFANHELLGVVACVDGLHALGKTADNLLTGRRGYREDFVNLTIGHFDHTMSKSLQSNIMSDHDHRDFLPHIQVDQDLHDDVSATRVQITSRFIEEQDLGLVRDRAGNRDTLLLTAGKLVGEVIHSLLQADILE